MGVDAPCSKIELNSCLITLNYVCTRMGIYMSCDGLSRHDQSYNAVGLPVGMSGCRNADSAVTFPLNTT